MIQKVDAAVVGIGGGLKIVFAQERKWMCEGVHLQRDTLFDPRLQLRIVGADRQRHDTEGGASIDLLEPVQNGADKGLIPLGLFHIVDRQNDGCIDARFSNPLRSGECRKIQPGIEWV